MLVDDGLLLSQMPVADGLLLSAATGARRRERMHASRQPCKSPVSIAEPKPADESQSSHPVII